MSTGVSVGNGEVGAAAGLGWQDVWMLRKAAARIRYGTEAARIERNGAEEDAIATDHLDSLADRLAELLRPTGRSLR